MNTTTTTTAHNFAADWTAELPTPRALPGTGASESFCIIYMGTPKADGTLVGNSNRMTLSEPFESEGVNFPGIYASTVTLLEGYTNWGSVQRILEVAANGITDIEPLYALANREGEPIIPENAVHHF